MLQRLKGEDVDDVAAIKNIIKSLLSTIDKLLFSVQVPKDVPLFDGVSGNQLLINNFAETFIRRFLPPWTSSTTSLD